MKQKAVVIFSGYNQRAIVAFLRIAVSERIPFYIIASSPEDPILSSTYNQNVFHIRQNKELSCEAILPVLKELRQTESLDELIILPSTEYLNRVMLRQRNDFSVENASIPIVEERIYEKISDKYEFRQLCQDHGLLVPRIYKTTDELEFPCVIKPKKYFSQGGKVQFRPQLIYFEEQWEKFRKEKHYEDFYIEEYVDGRSFYLLYYLSKDGVLLAHSQENLVQQGSGGSILAARSAKIQDQAISKKYHRLLMQLGFYGLIMIELRESEKGMCMIEANPRLWGPSQLFVDANVPIFERFLQDAGFNSSGGDIKHQISDSKYFWLGGLGSKGLNDLDLAFHGITREEFNEQLDEYQEVDIYKRPDTLSIFENELKLQTKQ